MEVLGDPLENYVVQTTSDLGGGRGGGGRGGGGLAVTFSPKKKPEKARMRLCWNREALALEMHSQL